MSQLLPHCYCTPVKVKQVTVFLEKVISRQFPADTYHEIDSDGTRVKEYGFDHFTS
jgi:hypothetical protein